MMGGRGYRFRRGELGSGAAGTEVARGICLPACRRGGGRWRGGATVQGVRWRWTAGGGTVERRTEEERSRRINWAPGGGSVGWCTEAAQMESLGSSAVEPAWRRTEAA